MKTNKILLGILLFFSMVFVVNAAAPVITSTAVTEVDVGDTYIYNVVATDADENDTLTYSLTTFPTGMVINPTTGQITWPTDDSDINDVDIKHDVTVEVSDGVETDTQSFKLDVKPLVITDVDLNDDVFKPGEEIVIKVDIENIAEDMDIEGITIFVEIRDNGDILEDDDGDDMEDEADVGRLKAGKEENNVEFRFIIPSENVDDGDVFTVYVRVEGDDEDSSADFEDEEMSEEFKIKKDDEEITIRSASLNPETISCVRGVDLDIELVNTGSDDSDEIVLIVRSDQLGGTLAQIEDINLDEGDTTRKTVSFAVSADKSAGIYGIDVITYFDYDRWEDGDKSDSKIVKLTVSDCVILPPTPEEPEEEEEEEETEVITPPTGGVVIPVESEEKPLLSVENAYLAGLILVNILLMLGILYLIVKLLTRK